MLFYRFISENLTSYINKDEQRSGNKDFDFAKLSDEKAEFGRADTIKEKGFYILPSELFVNVRMKARHDANLIAVSTYVAQKDTREAINITKLNAEIKGIVARQNELREAIDAIVADIEGK